jgi:nicotinate-nucleotide pyrophosphorylase (carboxylating)
MAGSGWRRTIGRLGRMTEIDPARSEVVEAVTRALAEDLGPLGDLTSALLPAGTTARATIASRRAGVLAGTACATEVFAQVDASVEVSWRRHDGSLLEAGTVVATVSGPLASMLTAERTALNFLCHLSGVASLTRRFVDAVTRANPATRVLDTRKTTPGLRALEKAAVRAGGGHNHRRGLSDAVLIKDNHLSGMSIAEAVSQARRRWPGRSVEVECDRPEQVDEAVAATATVVMLDNMPVVDVARCAARVHSAGTGILVEVSGGIDLETAPAMASAGADLISIGALTHSAPILDLGLDIEERVAAAPAPPTSDGASTRAGGG